MSNPHYDAILAQVDSALSGPAIAAGISYQYTPGRSITMEQRCEGTTATWIADYDEHPLRVRRWYSDGSTTVQFVHDASTAIRNGGEFIAAPCR